MTPSQHLAPPSRLLARLVTAGIALAVVALGALAVWAAIVTQNEATGLSQAGVQTSGHLRAVQALSMIDTHTDTLEDGHDASEVAKLRGAQRVLDDALDRMQYGGSRQASEIAEQGQPIVVRLKPAIERFLTTPPGGDSDGSSGPEEEMENTITELQVLLNDLDPDPSQLLVTKLDAVTATENTVRATAFVLIPLGLASVAVCGWLLSLYRRRSEATMREALATTAHEARTDELTGLPNRRALLEELASRSDAAERFTLTLADLNGFKRYNDTFGHPAGDALLRRLGRKLTEACDGLGIAARLGGDEFCVLLSADLPPGEVQALVTAALSDEGEGFRITAASGVVAVPVEAGDATAALRLADSRMYASKVGMQPSADHAMTVTLTRMLDARHPGLASHVEDVANLAVACAEALGLSADEVRTVEQAAHLHDIGKVAVPSAILSKDGPLSPEEWEFVQRHSIIGQRILGGVPALEDVATLVRSSHERWDGRGYPDGVSHQDIPIGARIVFVADAFCAMRESRAYAGALSIEAARQELRVCSGTQFDPAVVRAFLTVLDGSGAPMAGALST